MCTDIKSIIREYDDLHVITINKPSKDKKTWTFEVNDKTSKLNGVCDKIINYRYKIVTLQRKNHFFISYKIFLPDGGFEYFVDPKKSLHRTSVKKFIEMMMNYMIWSNDISYLKNDSSFKYTQMEMYRDGIDNYLDLCVKFGDFSSIGSGLTRDVRNLIVLDIDVNCEKDENKKELERIISLCSRYDFTPNFYIFNHKSKHVQLQWLVKSFQYKQVYWDNVNEKIKYLETSKDNKELYLNDFNFMDLSPEGLKYRQFTRCLTNISDKYKFGDKNYTFWKSKNFYAAYLGKYDLELKMPKVVDGEISYLTRDEMRNIFSSKESRNSYYNESPTIEEIYEKTSSFIDTYSSLLSEKSISKIKDDIKEIFKEDTFELYDYTKKDNYDLSRNTYVFNCTRNATWDFLRNVNFKDKNDFNKLTQRNKKILKNKIKKEVKSKYEIENDKFHGYWPGTTNQSKYTISEFNSTFDNSFDFAVEHFINNSYDDDSRKKSLDERILKKKLRHVLIIYLQSNCEKIKNKELLMKINNVLVNSNHQKISISTFKRDMKEIKKYDEKDKEKLFEYIFKNINERKEQLSQSMEIGDKKDINVNKKKLNRILLENIDDIVDRFS